MKYLVLILCCVYLGKAQILKPKQEAVIRSTIASQFGWEIANSAILNLGKASYCVVGLDTLYKLAGYHYVFKLQGDTALRLDKSKFHGIDNYSTIFNWQNKLYCIGGYGMFISHNTLKYFNVKTKEWTYLPVSGNAPASINGLCFKKDSIIYSFNNFNSGNNTNSDKIIDGLYCLNLNSLTWKVYSIDKSLVEKIKNDFKMQIFVLEDYIIQVTLNTILIIDVKSLDVFNLPCENINFKYGSIVSKINHNTIYTVSDSITFNKSDILKFKIGNLKTNNTNTYYLLPVLLVILISAIWLYIYKQSKQTKSKNIYESEDDLIKKLFENTNAILSIDELDTVLNIFHLESDSKRLRRHRILSEIEQQIPGLITRVKDPNDKRKFLYKINKNEINLK